VGAAGVSQVPIRWTQNNHFGNVIYLTDERWDHIIGGNNHPEMAGFEEYLKKTIRLGIRKQDPLNPHKYRYTKKFEDLPEGNTHIVAIVLFRLRETSAAEPVPNNYIVTAYQKEMG
jgi:hypothetical protein